MSNGKFHEKKAAMRLPPVLHHQSWFVGGHCHMGAFIFTCEPLHFNCLIGLLGVNLCTKSKLNKHRQLGRVLRLPCVLDARAYHSHYSFQESKIPQNQFEVGLPTIPISRDVQYFTLFVVSRKEHALSSILKYIPCFDDLRMHSVHHTVQFLWRT